MQQAAIKQWLLNYAWLGTADEKAANVDCIMAQDDWRYLDARTEQLNAQVWDPDEDNDTEGFALSALYECHDEPHLPTCPSVTGYTTD